MPDGAQVLSRTPDPKAGVTAPAVQSDPIRTPPPEPQSYEENPLLFCEASLRRGCQMLADDQAAEALAFFEEAADHGDEQAEHNAAVLVSLHSPHARRRGDAIKVLRKGAASGELRAQVALWQVLSSLAGLFGSQPHLRTDSKIFRCSETSRMNRASFGRPGVLCSGMDFRRRSGRPFAAS